MAKCKRSPGRVSPQVHALLLDAETEAVPQLLDKPHAEVRWWWSGDTFYDKGFSMF